MAAVIVIALAAAALMLAVGALLGRVRAYGRLAVADPRRDEGNEGRPPAAREAL